MNRTRFPTLFAIAMDYLPIQASSIPCERVFSSSAEMDTKKRNQIRPTLMEALQMLKYHYKRMRLDFCCSENRSSSHADLIEDDPDEPDDRGMKQGGNCDINDGDSTRCLWSEEGENGGILARFFNAPSSGAVELVRDGRLMSLPPCARISFRSSKEYPKRSAIFMLPIWICHSLCGSDAISIYLRRCHFSMCPRSTPVVVNGA